MLLNRFSQLTENYRLPRPSTSIRPTSFLMCPAALCPCGLEVWQQLIYQRAFAEAVAVARPSLPERDLAGTWN